MDTRKRNFVVTVKETGKGQPWLLFEPYEDLGMPRGLHVTLDVADGATIEEAKEVAAFLNQRVKGLRIAKF
jgi:hypothetical protein